MPLSCCQLTFRPITQDLRRAHRPGLRGGFCPSKRKDLTAQTAIRQIPPLPTDPLSDTPLKLTIPLLRHI